MSLTQHGRQETGRTSSRQEDKSETLVGIDPYQHLRFMPSIYRVSQGIAYQCIAL